MTKNFKLEEFVCKCGCNEVHVDEGFIRRLQQARTIAGTPFRINSGYRCENHPEEQNRPEPSAHQNGKAADIKVEGSRERYLILAALVLAGFTRIGVGRTFIHADVDQSKDPMVVWLY